MIKLILACQHNNTGKAVGLWISGLGFLFKMQGSLSFKRTVYCYKLCAVDYCSVRSHNGKKGFQNRLHDFKTNVVEQDMN